mmetsp:Transcript_11579/g.34282  ORF Transcript_11579/g.34282 Transcript_11579/m.34282 type:complete len:206 (+) Transcript_11579:405-1022(+)
MAATMQSCNSRRPNPRSWTPAGGTAAAAQAATAQAKRRWHVPSPSGLQAQALCALTSTRRAPTRRVTGGAGALRNLRCTSARKAAACVRPSSKQPPAGLAYPSRPRRAAAAAASTASISVATWRSSCTCVNRQASAGGCATCARSRADCATRRTRTRAKPRACRPHHLSLGRTTEGRWCSRRLCRPARYLQTAKTQTRAAPTGLR